METVPSDKSAKRIGSVGLKPSSSAAIETVSGMNLACCKQAGSVNTEDSGHVTIKPTRFVSPAAGSNGASALR